MSRSSIAFVAAAFAVALFAPQDAEAVYPTNSCVSSKQKAAGKFCASALKAWSGYAKDPLKSGADAKRDAAITKAATKLDSSWTKAELKSASKNADCTLATVDATTAETDLLAAVVAIETAVSNGVNTGDSGDNKCRSGILKSAAKLCGSYLKAESKFIKTPGKDPDRSGKAASKTKADGKFSSGYTKAVGTCSAGQADEATVVSDVNDLTNALRLSTIIGPGMPTSFTHVVEGAPGVGEESWGTTSLDYEKRTLTPRCSKDTPYSFHYKAGTENKLLMYYQGGGACWDGNSCFTLNTFKNEAGAGDNPDLVGTGYADPLNPDNQFANWHVVFVSYCTGDVHWGDTTTTYGAGQQINHFGYQHALMAEKWARERFVDPDEVFVTGSSAGSYGAILNSVRLMEEVYPASLHNVLGDAGTGVITEDFLNFRIQNWGVDPNLPDVLDIKTASEISSPEMWIRIAEGFPNNRFAQYQSAYDGSGGGQAAFYNVMKNQFTPGNWAFWWMNNCEWTACMRDYIADISAAVPNFRYYTGAGSRHTVWGSDKIYTDTTDGLPTLDSWVDSMIANDAGWVSVDCQDAGDCDLVDTCQGGANAGLACTSDLDCPGGTCEFDPDAGVGNTPYNGDGTTTCPATTCPCDSGTVCAD